MPIKFACPTCKATMTVKDEMAGKRGKCKCGAAITVPTPKAQPAAAPPQVASGFDDALGDLTESDYASKSPYEQVYAAGPAANNDRKALKRFENEIASSKKFKKGQLSPMMIFVAVLDFIQAVGYLAGAAAISFIAAAVYEQVADQVPMFRLGVGIIIAICVVIGLLYVAAGVGFLMLKPWGWFLTATAFMFALSERIVTLGMIIYNGFEQGPFFGGMFGFVFTFGFVSFVYNSDVQENYGIKNLIPGAMAAILGIGISAGLNTAAIMMEDDAPAAASVQDSSSVSDLFVASKR